MDVSPNIGVGQQGPEALSFSHPGGARTREEIFDEDVVEFRPHSTKPLSVLPPELIQAEIRLDKYKVTELLESIPSTCSAYARRSGYYYDSIFMMLGKTFTLHHLHYDQSLKSVLLNSSFLIFMTIICRWRPYNCIRN